MFFILSRCILNQGGGSCVLCEVSTTKYVLCLEATVDGAGGVPRDILDQDGVNPYLRNMCQTTPQFSVKFSEVQNKKRWGFAEQSVSFGRYI